MQETAILSCGLDDYAVYKISPNDSNKFALICGAGDHEALPFMMCIEIFDVGGATPVNQHQAAYEHFFVLHGTGRASIGEALIDLMPGSHVLVPPKTSHIVENTGDTRLYVLTTMAPDESFSALIRSGVPATLDEQDKRVLAGR